MRVSRSWQSPGLCPTQTKKPPRFPSTKPPIVPPPPKVTARARRPLWRDLILRVWGADPLQCPCCKGTMKVVDTFFRAGEIEFFLRLHGLWEWKRSGHRLPSGSPKRGAAAASTRHRHPTTTGPALRHRKTARERRRFGRRRSRSPQGEPAKRGGRIKPSSPSNHRGRPSANGFWPTMGNRVSTCPTSAPTPASQSRSPAKTVAFSSSIPTEATESTALKKPLPKKCLAKRRGSSFLRRTLERMKLATTASSLGKFPERSSVTSALSSAPHSPTPVSRSDRFRREGNCLAGRFT